MNKRITDLVHLLAESKESLTVSELSQKFGVSERTIRNDLTEINEQLRRNRFTEIIFRGRSKIQLPDSFDKMLPELAAKDLYDYKLSKKERKWVSAAILTSSAGYITLADIADRLFVSRATIINDLDGIKLFVHQAGLEVLSHPSKGLWVTGPESRKRLLLTRLSCYHRKRGEDTNIVSQFVSFQSGDRVTLQKILNEQEHRYGAFLTDDSFQETTAYLGILVERSQRGEFLEDQELPPSTENSKYLMAQDILRYVSQYCAVTVTEDDIRLLAKLLVQARYMRQKKSELGSIPVQMLTRQFIESVSEELEINLTMDYDLFENLSNHLQSVFRSSSTAYSMDSEILEEVLEENQDVFEAVRQKAEILRAFTQRDLKPVELDYIAIHVCAALERKKNKEIAFHVIVACHAGIGTSHLLLERLRKHFKFQVVDIVSAHEVCNIPADKADFVISTVPLKGFQGDYVVVSPGFNDADYVRVGNKINALRNSRHLSSRIDEKTISAKGMIEKIRPVVYEYVPEQAADLMRQLRRVIRGYFNQSIEAEAEIFSPYLHHLLPQSHIQLDVECCDWKDAVRKSAEKLLEWGYIEARYIDAMIANIEENGPYVVLSKGFAVPHEGLEQGSLQVGMYLIRLKEPIAFGAEEFDPVEFVCCLSAIDHRTHLKAFFNLVNMLQNQEFKEMLRNCQTTQEVAAVIEKYEYQVMN